MADLSCRQAELLEADVEMGRATEADRMRVEVHLQRCESCAERTERIRALTEALRTEPIEARVPDRALVASALMDAHDGSARSLSPGPALPWLAAAAALLAIGSAAWWMATRDTPAPIADDDAPSETVPERVMLAGRASPCDAVVTEAAEGARAYVVDSHDRVCRVRLDAGELRLHVEPGAGVDLVVATPTANVKVVGTVFSVGVEDGFTSVVVYRGTVEVSRDQETLRVTGGHRVGLARDREALVESASEEALRPLVELEEETGTTAAASEAHEAVQAPDTPEEPVAQEPSSEAASSERARERRRTPSAATTEAEPPEEPADGAVIADLRRLLREGHPEEARQQALDRTEQTEHTRRRGELYTVIAESYEMQLNWRAAYDWYDRVQRVSQGTATAANALIASASLALERLGRPADAVRLFESYLRQYPRGALHEDAYVGRCRALMAAGQRSRAESCARAYLTTFPTGRHRDRAERLLGEQR